MSAQPTGIVTFLFTDIEGSTKLWEQYPTAMRTALKRHDEILRHAIRAHRGYVFKTIGDAFCAAFANPADAIAAADMAQRLLREEPWGETGPLRARMAIHTGEPEARDGDYFGQPVNRVARLLAIGHGQQVLVSDASRELVGDRLPSGSQLRARGKHRLKDLNLPQPVFQLISTDWPVNLKELKSLPSPVSGAVAALGTGGITVVSYALRSRTTSEGFGTSLLSPVSLYTSFKGLLIDLSTLNERFLLGVGLLLLLLCVAVAVARRWQLKREENLRMPEGGRVFNWVVNQRTFTFLAVLAVVALGAYAYQQYLWRVALPIPDDATGFAITREASASSFQDQLADTLFTQGQADEIVIRELPVVFDASDTERARELGTRINAEAVIIYRVDEAPRKESERYVAYVVFTDPNIGLVLGAPGDTQGPGPDLSTPPVQMKEGVPVPVLKTATLEELVNAAAGIIDYNDHRMRDAIEHLEQAVPQEAGASNTGIVQFYLGNAHQIDGNAPAATTSLESAANFYENQASEDGALGVQDALILLKAYAKLGEIAWMQGNEEGALAWFDKGLPLREDLVSRADGLERPSDVPATYARLYTLMADTYEALDRPEDEAFWQERAMDELGRVATLENAEDPYPLLQEANALFFMGQCVPAADIYVRALAIDPDNLDAQTGSGIVAFFQGRDDLAVRAWQQIIDQHPEAIQPRVLIANVLVLRGITDDYTEIGYLLEAERLLGEVITLDPTNVAAHDTIADLALLRAQSATLDSTALAQGDDLSFNKSQAEWIHQPEHQQQALEAYAVVIEHRRVIASELRTDNPSSAAEVATAYAGREGLLFSLVLNDAIMRESSEPDNATPSAATPVPNTSSWEEMLLADGEQILTWSERVLDDPDAPRLAVLEAHAARVGALQHVWFWSAYISPDEERSTAAAEAYRDAVAESIAFGEMEPLALDEIPSMRLIYFSAQSLAMFLDDDQEAAVELEGKIADITSREMTERTESTTNLLTTCDEVRETAAGDTARGDTAEAMAHYDAALEANPDHVAALLGAAKIRFGEGDLEGAIAMVERATGTSAPPYAAWAELALYRTVSGDLDGAREAYDRFFTLLGDQGPQSRLFAIEQAIDDLHTLWEDGRIDAAGMRESLVLFASFLDGLADDAIGSYQYAALYARLGSVALLVDAPDDAEAWLRRALELDPHQPAVYADLVVAVAMRGGDVDAIIAMALDEARDPLWTATVDYDPEWVLDEMDEAAVSLRETFPDQTPALDAFRDAIEEERS